MTRSKRMQPVADVADRQEKEQARQLGEAQHLLEEQKYKLQQLIEYRDDYGRQFENAGSAGFSAGRLQDYRAFLNKLNAAIEQQKGVIAEAERRCEVEREKWRACRTKAKALDKVVDRYEREENREREKQEQRDSDEYALQRHHRKDR